MIVLDLQNNIVLRQTSCCSQVTIEAIAGDTATAAAGATAAAAAAGGLGAGAAAGGTSSKAGT